MLTFAINSVSFTMKSLILIFLLMICSNLQSQNERSAKINVFISPVIYQLDNINGSINTINSNHVSVNTYSVTTSEIGLNYTYNSNKIKFGGGISLKNYAMKFDINISQFDITERNVNLFFSKERELKSNSVGFHGIIGYQLTNTTSINFIVNYYNSFSFNNNTVSGIEGEIGISDFNGFNVTYEENSSLFGRPKFIPEINVTTALINGFFLNYGIKSKFRKRNYFSASITGQTSSSSDQETLLNMNTYSRHTALYVGIGYNFDVKKPIKPIKLD